MSKKTSRNNGSSSSTTTNIAELARWVPLRLTAQERSLLTVLEQTLHVSEYTDHVDVTASRRGGLKTRRILDGILEVCHIATGLAIVALSSSSDGPVERRRLADIVVCQEESNDNTTMTTVKKKKKKKGKKVKLKRKKKSKKNGTTTTVSNNNNNNNNKHGSSSSSSSLSSSWASRDPADNAALFQTMFEIGRRNKVLNPSSMRTTYGKLMYLMQDAQNPTVARSLGFSLHKDLQLVGPYLEEHGCEDLLNDPRLECAVQYISDRDPATGERLERKHVEAMVQGKQRVLQQLVETYAEKPTSQLSAENIRRAIESLADAVAYIESNVQPVQRMLKYLEDNFDPNQPVKPFSLALHGSSRGGYYSNSYSKYGLSAYSSGSSEGPTLSHSHSTQYTFVWQSLRLWSKVQRHMHRLWVCADDDLLSTTCTYHLYNTGQGLNRVQMCPRVRKVMTSLLHQTQQETTAGGGGNGGNTWVGLSVIHLGDRDVPNALIFIDKYTQIPRFLSPIVSFLQSLLLEDSNNNDDDELCSQDDERIDDYIKTQFGSKEKLKMVVLCDYFKHGFDGSGDDGGSCIDGRLTSSWNWTSRVAKKSYYHAFMLSGFQGFDGDFR